MTSESEYNVLKERIVQHAGTNFSLQLIKDFFSADINSARSLSHATSLVEVLELLEHRDILHSKNVMALHCIGELLKISKIKEDVRVYIKLYLDGSDEALCICGFSSPYIPRIMPLSGQNQNFFTSSRTVSDIDNLSQALENVALSIGDEWPILARELGLYEGQIDLITSGSAEEKARQALLLWLRNEQENASVELLDKALEARLCKRRGIGVHLRHSIAGITC